MAMKSEDIKLIKELLRVIKQSGLGEVEIEMEGITVRTSLQSTALAPTPFAPAPFPAPSLPAAPLAVPASAPEPAVPTPKSSAQEDANLLTIRSPMVGTFYQASSPEAAPYVLVGDKIEKGQTICIVEAMKLFNEIEAEVSGTLVEVLADNASPVEYDQPLFVVNTQA